MDAGGRATPGAVAEEVQGWAISETRMVELRAVVKSD